MCSFDQKGGRFLKQKKTLRCSFKEVKIKRSHVHTEVDLLSWFYGESGTL